MKIIFASNNQGKVKELRSLLGPESGVELQSLLDVGAEIEFEESGDTFFDNALIKARAAAEKCGEYCLADDSGLEVDALSGAPGVYSARYAGENANDNDNNTKLLKELQGGQERSARFVCVLVLVDPAGKILASVEGKCEGSIAQECRGNEGFGYDSLFIPQGEQRTLGELPLAEKNKVSHRAQACRLMAKQLERLGS